MDLYKYVAENPSSQQAAIRLVENNGMQPQNDTDLADCLSDYVNSAGEKGLRKILAIHPDRDLLVDMFAPKQADVSQRSVNMKNAIGDTNNTQVGNATATDSPSTTALQTNIFIITGAILIALAIVSSSR